MLNVRTNTGYFALLLLAMINSYANSSDSIPIAEYCVVYETKRFCDCEADYIYASVYLRLEKILEKQDDLPFCSGTKNHNFYWLRKFLIHEDLKVERNSLDGIYFSYDEILKTKNNYIVTTIAEWDFASEVPIYAKDTNSVNSDKEFPDTNRVDSSKYGKYYEKGRVIPVEWQLKAKCGSRYETTYSGSYFIRITGECPK
jgi:hypothetical protein